jgi:osmoprotectant transport system permease protein
MTVHRPQVLAGLAATIIALVGVVGVRGALAEDLARVPALRVGSKRFTESAILAEIAVAAARRAGDARVSHDEGLGGTALVFRALEQGAIDVYPEYTGTIAEAILHTPGRADVSELRRALAPRGIAMTDSLGFDNTYAIAVTSALASSHHLERLSDLARTPDLRFGLSPEFLGRRDGFTALAAAYGLRAAHVEALEHGLAYEALARGAIDATDVYSTDAKIRRYDLVVLGDNRHFFPSYEAVFLYRLDAAARAPASIRAISDLAGTIDAPTMIRMNARVELDGLTFAEAASEVAVGRTAPNDTGEVASGGRRAPLLRGLLSVIATEGPRHVELVASSLGLAVAVGVPLGVIAAEAPALGRVLVGATSVAQTIPALALLCFFVPFLGTGKLPALAALFVYGLLPIVRNTVAGLQGIAPPLREAAVALGLGRWARLVSVELPLASRTILAGVQTSAVVSVGGATLAAFVGAGGFGAPISAGLNLDDTDLILQGAIPAALLALAVEGSFALATRALVPRGLRRTRASLFRRPRAARPDGSS